MTAAKRCLLLIVIASGIILGFVGIASSITNGTPDGNGHPYVGLAVFDVGGHPAYFCSGSLISPTVFLTAGHCTSGATAGRVWFASQASSDPHFPYSGGTSIEASAFHTNPGFCLGCARGLPGLDTHDVGVVILSMPVEDKGYALLPSPGLVDTLPMNTEVTIVGYGGQVRTRQRPPHIWLQDWMRYHAPTSLIQTNDVFSDEFMKLTANPAQGTGGVCFGDSGGPDLLGNIVLAVNSFVANGNCAGITYSYRVDSPDALGFIQSFLPNP